MTTHDNAPPPADWSPEPKCCPFANCRVCETTQQAIWLHGSDAHMTDNFAKANMSDN